jgi:hypothetical protein
MQSNAISHAEMNAAYDSTAAVPLAPSVTWLTRYQDSWWVVYEGGWLQVTDELTIADIDSRAARLNAAGPGGEESCPQPRS